MAKLEFINTDIKSDAIDDITQFLKSEGILFGQFELNDTALKLASQERASDEERQALLASYPELTALHASTPGFHSDVVFLHPGFPHYEMLVKQFGDIHYHYENEYWYFFGGHFDFGFLGTDGRKFYIRVDAGEYLSVQEGKWQWLRGTVHQQMKAMRFFNCTNSVAKPTNLIFERS